MSITITITDPHLLTPGERRRLVEYLNPSERETVVSFPIAPPVSATQFVPPTPVLGGVYPSTPQSQWTPEESARVAAMQNAASLPPTTIPPGPAVAPNLDSRGYPWDARIHSDSKSKNANGTWRYRRGVKEDVIEPVEAELRGVMGVGTALPVAPEPAMEPVVEPQGAAMQQVSVPVIEPVVVPPPPPAPDASGDDFNHLANIATKALAAKTITQAQVSEILNAVGEANGCVLPHLGALFTRKDLIPAVREKLQALIAAGGAV